MVGSVRVALLGDQDRAIVRLMPIEACVGIGVPSPKGTDPMMYRGVVKEKLAAVAPSAHEAAEFDGTPKSVPATVEPLPPTTLPPREARLNVAVAAPAPSPNPAVAPGDDRRSMALDQQIRQWGGSRIDTLINEGFAFSSTATMVPTLDCGDESRDVCS